MLTHPCEHCSEIFHLRKDLLTHLQSKHVNQIVSCAICQKVFSKQSCLRLHMQEHSHQYTCSLCGQTFSQKHHYTGHMNKHVGAKPFQCKNCLKCFGYATNLARHSKNCVNHLV